jgi:hypothetical protein
MTRFTRRQRLVLIALSIGNLVILGGLGALWALSSRQHNVPLSLLLQPAQREACERATAGALLDAGHSALVQTRVDGLILVQLPPVTASGPEAHLRLAADAAVWAALEAVAGQRACLRFHTVKATVVLAPVEGSSCQAGQCPQLQASAQASVVDLLAWAQGEIDDAELARRLDYRPPDPNSTPLPAGTPTP